jgi:hypothetical protein
MNNYVQTAITYYNPNKETYIRVSNVQDAVFESQQFEGDGTTDSFILTVSFTVGDDTIFKVLINDVIVTNYTYDSATNAIVFEDAPILGNIIDVNLYNDSVFLGELTKEDITLLSMATCIAWAMQIHNNQLDIDRSLNDTDFKQNAIGPTQNAKVDWVKHFEEMYKRELSKSDWRPKFRGL